MYLHHFPPTASALALSCCLLLGCAVPQPKPRPELEPGARRKPDAPRGMVPSAFQAHFIDVGGCRRVELSGGVLVYRERAAGVEHEPVRVTPTEEQWREFRAALDAALVWEWRALYRDPVVACGTSWGLHLEYSDWSLATEGHNGYPEGPHFSVYREAVSKLLGREFR